MFEYSIIPFEKLSNTDLINLLKLRQDVFIIEQNCVYPDIDGLDSFSQQVLVHDKSTNELVATTRILPRNTIYDVTSIGRIATVMSFRGRGIGSNMIEKSITFIEKNWEEKQIKLSAQSRLEEYYQQFGFKKNSAPYMDAGIEHIDMIRKK